MLHKPLILLLLDVVSTTIECPSLNQIFSNENAALSYWGNSVKSIENYSEVEHALQVQKNKEAEQEFVLTWNPIPDNLEYGLTKNEEIPLEYRSIDNEEITPYTWKWVHLKLTEPNGSVIDVKLRRPNWWFVNNNATSIGAIVPISIEEVGISGLGIVQSIWASQIDTRISSFDKNADQTYRPITGWFSRTVENTYDYTFSNGDVIGSTPNHFFFSPKTSTFVPVGDFKIGDEVQLADGTVVQLTDFTKRDIAEEQVYNLEVWREHVYYVGSGVLVHNSCWKASNLAKLDADDLVKMKSKFSANFKLLHGTYWKAPSPSRWKFDNVPDGYMFYVVHNNKKVYFDYDGFPDFTTLNHSPGKAFNFFQPNGYSGNHTSDLSKAVDFLVKKFPNRVKKTGTGTTCTVDGIPCSIHHHQDLKSLFPVYKSSHKDLSHVGKAITTSNKVISFLSPWSF